MEATIRISEIFGPTIQGEGALIGQPTIFVRTGGCDYRCRWCDTLHAVDSAYRREWRAMSAENIMEEIERLSSGHPTMVTLSGGNPAIQPLGSLITLGHERGYRFALETQGSIAKDWFADLDVLTLSPKPPSSGHKTDWDAFTACLAAAKDGPQTALKIVVFDDADYAYARDVQARYPALAFYLQPGNHKTEGSADLPGLNARLTWLADKVTNDNMNAQVLPQLHVMLWGNKRGV
ncbi:MAG: 7-carboxy-7-deazaguanine synthase QueE [Rhodospirillales bacterium]|nr:7-carboxy-7-deazaguanine synthase QueE [Rhodospirillales bacterium]